MPAALASSSAYWISGLSTTGSISFGSALVAGRMRVPSPATGNTALRTGFCMELLDRGSRAAPRLLQTPRTVDLFSAMRYCHCEVAQRRRHALMVQQHVAGAADLGGEG